MTSQWRHGNKTNSSYSELNPLENVYFGIFIVWKLTEWRRFVTYLWNDPRIWIFCRFCTRNFSYWGFESQNFGKQFRPPKGTSSCRMVHLSPHWLRLDVPCSSILCVCIGISHMQKSGQLWEFFLRTLIVQTLKVITIYSFQPTTTTDCQTYCQSDREDHSKCPKLPTELTHLLAWNIHKGTLYTQWITVISYQFIINTTTNLFPVLPNNTIISTAKLSFKCRLPK